MKGLNVRACVISIGLILTIVAVGGAADKTGRAPSSPQAFIHLENSLVRIEVDDTDGNFGIGTSSLHPRPCETLLYGFDCGDTSSTSNIKVSVDGAIWDLADQTGNCDGEATYVSSTIVGDSIESRWTIPSPALSVLVKHTPVLFDATTAAILTETFVTNNSGTSHQIGVLYEYDTEVADNDSAEIAAGGTWYPNETCFASVPFTYWEAFEDTVPPGAGDLIGRATMTGGAAVPPDRMAIGQWGDFVDVCWLYDCDGEPYGDSAVIYWWDEDPVAAAATRRVGTYYGVGDVSIAQGDLAITLSAPSSLQCRDLNPEPNPFGLTAFVTNTTGGLCSGVSATLTLSPGLTTGSPLTVPLGGIAAGDTNQAFWNVTATGDPCDAAIGYEVTVTSTDCGGNVANDTVTVPCCTLVTPTVAPRLRRPRFRRRRRPRRLRCRRSAAAD